MYSWDNVPSAPSQDTSSGAPKKYAYRFIEVPKHCGRDVQPGDTFAECKRIILAEAEQGWRLKQIVTPFHEKAGVSAAYCYQIILEKAL